MYAFTTSRLGVLLETGLAFSTRVRIVATRFTTVETE